MNVWFLRNATRTPTTAHWNKFPPPLCRPALLAFICCHCLHPGSCANNIPGCCATAIRAPAHHPHMCAGALLTNSAPDVRQGGGNLFHCVVYHDPMPNYEAGTDPNSLLSAEDLVKKRLEQTQDDLDSKTRTFLEAQLKMPRKVDIRGCSTYFCCSVARVLHVVMFLFLSGNCTKSLLL